MRREPHIPLFLWIATAILIHLFWGGGAQEVSKLIDEQLDVQRFVRSVSSRVRREHQSIEVTLEEETKPEAPAEQESPLSSAEPPNPEEPKVDEANPKELVHKEELKEEKPKAPEKKPEEAKKEPEKKPETKPEVTAPVAAKHIELPRRIAVEQHVADEHQAPNPNAEFIGEHANHVEEQTQAKITSTEQNDAKPTPGGNHQGPSGEPGNAQVDEVAQAEDRAGNPDRAPGETTNGKAEHSAAAEPTRAGARVAATEASHGQGKAHSATDSQTKEGASSTQREQVASRAVEASPDLAAANGGGDVVAEAREAHAQQKGQTERKGRLPPPPGSRNPLNFLGLGASGTTASGINLNLTESAALATVGPEQLAKQIIADGERRRSAHRGSWHSTGLERWRSAIENYVPHVKPGNQTALNTAEVPFAGYLNRMHNRIHPIFAEQFLAHLDELPSSSPFNRMDIHTELEIVLNRNDGSIVDMGVTKLSGVTAFDIGALDSVSRASPFGAPPKAIVSPDGNVYLHWEFYRNPDYACSTYFAHPKMLRTDPKTIPPVTPTAPPGPFGPEESPVPRGEGQRQGELYLPALQRPSRQLAVTDQAG